MRGDEVLEGWGRFPIPRARQDNSFIKFAFTCPKARKLLLGQYVKKFQKL
jgi:hypothetical protein